MEPHKGTAEQVSSGTRRIGDVFYIQSILGVVIWLGIYLREPRLWKLIPFRGKV